MKKTALTIALAFAFNSASVLAEQTVVAKSHFVHERSAVNSDGALLRGSQTHPAYKQLVGLLPKSWNLVFTKQFLAIAPLSWSEGDKWTSVLDGWGKTHNANVMIDGKRKQIVVSEEQSKRPAGTVFVYSGNELHQELYNPEQRYKEAEQYVYSRLEALQGTVHDEVNLHNAQATLFDLMVDTADTERKQAIAEAKKEIKPEPPIVRGALTIYPDGKVEAKLKEGFLKAQVIQLLVSAGKVSGKDSVIWNVSDNHRWPNTFTLKAGSVDELFARLLKTYSVKVRFTANKIAIVEYI